MTDQAARDTDAPDWATGRLLEAGIPESVPVFGFAPPDTEDFLSGLSGDGEVACVVDLATATDPSTALTDVLERLGQAGWFSRIVARTQPGEPAAAVLVIRRDTSSSLSGGPLSLTCYLQSGQVLKVRPGEVQRDWMDATPQQFAYRCLPLNIANAHGWDVLAPSGFTAVWHGGNGTEDITIDLDDPDAPDPAMSHFGSGVITFPVRGLFRTEPGYDLWVSGPPNAPKRHVYPLTGLIETDWLEFTFTMNWLMTTPNFPVRFEKGEPFCSFFPVPRGLAERFDPVFESMDANPELAEAFATYRDSRNSFNAGLKVEGSEERRQGWQRKYIRGPSGGNAVAQPHRTKVRLKPFRTRGA